MFAVEQVNQFSRGEFRDIPHPAQSYERCESARVHGVSEKACLTRNETQNEATRPSSNEGGWTRGTEEAEEAIKGELGSRDSCARSAAAPAWCRSAQCFVTQNRRTKVVNPQNFLRLSVDPPCIFMQLKVRISRGTGSDFANERLDHGELRSL